MASLLAACCCGPPPTLVTGWRLAKCSTTDPVNLAITDDEATGHFTLGEDPPYSGGGGAPAFIRDADKRCYFIVSETVTPLPWAGTGEWVGFCSDCLTCGGCTTGRAPVKMRVDLSGVSVSDGNECAGRQTLNEDGTPCVSGCALLQELSIDDPNGVWDVPRAPNPSVGSGGCFFELTIGGGTITYRDIFGAVTETHAVTVKIQIEITDSTNHIWVWAFYDGGAELLFEATWPSVFGEAEERLLCEAEADVDNLNVCNPPGSTPGALGGSAHITPIMPPFPP